MNQDDSQKTTASKDDKKKPDLSLIPQVFLNEVARAFMVGEVKYGRYNYCKGHKSSQLIAAMLRHITAYNDGQEYDPQDGQHHLGAAGACIAMLLRQQELGTLEDNRFTLKPDKAKSVSTPVFRMMGGCTCGNSAGGALTYINGKCITCGGKI